MVLAEVLQIVTQDPQAPLPEAEEGATDVPGENIRNEVLDENYVASYRTELGASVLVPINEQISPLVQSMFYGS